MTATKRRKSDVVAVSATTDHQVPFHDPWVIDATCQYLAEHHWDYHILGGDFLDLATISKYVIDKPGKQTESLILEDYALANKVLDGILKAVRAKNKDCRVVLLQGNHEARIDALYDRHPWARGLIDVAPHLRLEERDIEWVTSDTEGLVYRLEWGSGGVRGVVRRPEQPVPLVHSIGFIHGWFHNIHHAKKTLESYGHGDIYYGHCNGIQQVTTHRWGPHSARGGSIGVQCRLDMPYAKGRPNNWAHGFADFRLRADVPGCYSVFIPNFVNREFVGPDGRLFKSRSK